VIEVNLLDYALLSFMALSCKVSATQCVQSILFLVSSGGTQIDSLKRRPPIRQRLSLLDIGLLQGNNLSPASRRCTICDS
jgi:hypothetical protein